MVLFMGWIGGCLQGEEMDGRLVESRGIDAMKVWILAGGGSRR